MAREIAELLAANVASTQYEDLPQNVREVAKKGILDTLGMIVGANRAGQAKPLKQIAQTPAPTTRRGGYAGIVRFTTLGGLLVERYDRDSR